MRGSPGRWGNTSGPGTSSSRLGLDLQMPNQVSPPTDPLYILRGASPPDPSVRNKRDKICCFCDFCGPWAGRDLAFQGERGRWSTYCGRARPQLQISASSLKPTHLPISHRYTTSRVGGSNLEREQRPEKQFLATSKNGLQLIPPPLQAPAQQGSFDGSWGQWCWHRNKQS